MPDIASVQREAEEYVNPKYNLPDLELGSNIGNIPSRNLGWLKPFPASSSDEEILHELETKGVVHVKGVMSRDRVLAARRRWFEYVAPSGILRPNTDPTDGIFCGGDTTQFVGPDNAGYLGNEGYLHAKIAAKAHQEPWHEDFCSNPELFAMVKRINPDWKEPHIFRRQLYRSNVPHAKGTSTGVHYDQIFLRAGPPNALTAWVPIGDCSPMSGGLMYLEDSKKLGEEMEEKFEEMGKGKGLTNEERLSAFNANMGAQGMLSCDAGEFGEKQGGGRRWLIGDYEAGDAVFHHAHMIHASGTNHDPMNRIRLSADLRFADKAAPHETRWCKPFVPGDGL